MARGRQDHERLAGSAHFQALLQAEQHGCDGSLAGGHAAWRAGWRTRRERPGPD